MTQVSWVYASGALRASLFPGGDLGNKKLQLRVRRKNICQQRKWHQAEVLGLGDCLACLGSLHKRRVEPKVQETIQVAAPNISVLVHVKQGSCRDSFSGGACGLSTQHGIGPQGSVGFLWPHLGKT